jgi:hypothetical protein
LALLGDLINGVGKKATVICGKNGGLNQILKRQTSPFHYGLKSPTVTITVFTTIQTLIGEAQ